MALFNKGNLNWKRQAGLTGPKPDPAYNIFRLEEPWQGRQADLNAFLASKPLGSIYPTASWLRLSDYEVTYREAGIADVRLIYAGTASPGALGTSRFQRLLKSQSRQMTIRRRFERVASQTTLFAGGTTQTWANVLQEIPAEQAYQYYAPSITFRYTTFGKQKTPLFQSSAQAEIGALSPSVQVVAERITGQQWVTIQGLVTASNLEGLEIRNLTQFPFVEGGSQTPVLRFTDLVSEPEGQSGYYKNDETWEIDLA
jgi:hypothetical protein